MKTIIELGDKVEDIYTGFKGIAVAKTEFINGCIQIEVLPKVDKDNKQAEPLGIDEKSLKVISKKKKPVKKKSTGGSYTKGIIQRGF